MINITSKDIENFEYITQGTYGKIYKVNDHIAYKLYKDKVKDTYSGVEYNNPSLYIRKRRFAALIERCKDLEYTDGFYDTVYKDKKFSGVAMIYYKDAPTLYSLRDMPVDKKDPLSRELIRNAGEIIEHHIYPTDYNTSNVLLVDGKIKIIDIDDIRTHISNGNNLMLQRSSNKSLSYTLEDFHDCGLRYNMSRRVKKRLEKPIIKNMYSYDSMFEYLDTFDDDKVILFINDNSDINEVKKLYDKYDIKIVYSLRNRKIKDRSLIKRIDFYNDKDIPIYDFVLESKKDDYYKSDNITEEYVIEDKQLKKIYSR